MNIEQLNKDFEKLNLLREKNSMDRIKFCWKLIESDNNEYLEYNLFLSNKANKYFSKDLQEQFQFRKDKEKVFYFLQDKLEQNTSDKLKTIINKIIKELDFKSLDEYQTWIKDIKLGKKNDENDFVWSIMKSPFVELHYELMKDEELSEGFRKSLNTRYNEHSEKGEALLLSKLDNNDDVDFHGEIIFILGKIKGPKKGEVLTHARKLVKSKNVYTRNRAIIVLGWIGESTDFEILENCLLYDLDKECRAWSATAFYIVYDRIKSKEFKTNTFKLFNKVLESEKDFFVLGMIIYSMRELTNKKFGISQKAIDELDVEKIVLTKEKIKRYLIKSVC
ncbi:HEAT repeat domain-containing protein [Cellulophaga baltica]|uniref:HEAT repeat-containing protein n=1 Tax=Cellulophaga baltica TaxID=76594 RepID=A0A1G7M4H0_9FLAO|nr:HEAT repeat domain-containing protein [Cellulophaga baltica]SDF56688.1 HEAT repeat-containing protein [Cellulophaga baltica]